MESGVEKYENVEISKIFKDVNFIVVRDAISKQKNNKYKDAKITKVEKLDKESHCTYVIDFELPNGLWKSKATINKKDFTVVIDSDELVEDRSQSVQTTVVPPVEPPVEKPSVKE